jgi:hypothetical protein
MIYIRASKGETKESRVNETGRGKKKLKMEKQ